MSEKITNPIDFKTLLPQIQAWGTELGFAQIGFSDIHLNHHFAHYQDWLNKGYHADMHYMQTNQNLRAHPNELMAGTQVVITARMNYLPPDAQFAKNLSHPEQAYISRYALGRDYHKLMRKRLAQLAERIQHHIGPYDYRAFVDSAPVLERALAEKSGQGWIGKNTLLINPKAGSWFFLGEIFTTLPAQLLEAAPNTAQNNQCGVCQACLQICPTQAIVAPYQLDARRCISYLTIENKGAIPLEFRAAIGNRIYGCDDCQLVCPWNRYSSLTTELDFQRRAVFKNASLLSLYQWDEQQFLNATEGSAIRRIGYQSWRRNLAVALGNAPYSADIVTALAYSIETSSSPLVVEHALWAHQQQLSKMPAPTPRKLIHCIEKMHPRDA